MGGKLKQTQRTKNNAKPSSSGRSAELLGQAVPSFVGFTAHTNLGMVPFAPGFSTASDNSVIPDNFDSCVSSQFQLVLRKLSKKDPITKFKALQEFTGLLEESEIDVIKAILPVWPKFYQNLAIDVDHRVRENAQIAQKSIASKAKKNIAPYLKQLAPVWIASQFDNYPPAASAADASFRSAFAPCKVREALTFCQAEILDYIIKNLTVHTASTLNTPPVCTTEEAELKYQRLVIASMKAFGFFLEKTDSSESDIVKAKSEALFDHPKFWSYAKNKILHIKSAWIEMVYNTLQYAPKSLEQHKAKVIQIVFNHIDDSDPLIIPHIWGTILLIQQNFTDWKDIINFKKTFEPKLISFIQTKLDGTAETFCPNLLPFLSKFPDTGTLEYLEMTAELFSAMKKAIVESFYDKFSSKSDALALVTSYYECIRFVLQNISSTSSPGNTIFCDEILQKFIINVISQSLSSNVEYLVKSVYNHSAALIAFWSKNSSKSELYSHLLRDFWKHLSELINSKIGSSEFAVVRSVDVVYSLYTVSSNLQTSKVRFREADTCNNKTNVKNESKLSYVEGELKNIAIDLTRLGLNTCLNEKSDKHLNHIWKLTELFPDSEFFSAISIENSIDSTLKTLKEISLVISEPSEVVIDIIFETIKYMDSKERRSIFLEKLLQTEDFKTQEWILLRLLSFPFCAEKEIMEFLSQNRQVSIIWRIAEEFIIDNAKYKLNLLHKCFFQNDNQHIIISNKAVEGIIRSMSKPLTTIGMEHMIDTCGSFLAQIVPVICLNDNASQTIIIETFLMLFKCSVDRVANDDLSTDTLWEITTTWQDALETGDIKINIEIFKKCTDIVKNRIENTDLDICDIENLSKVVAILIVCSSDNKNTFNKRLEEIDKSINVMFQYGKNLNSLANYCSLIDGILGNTSISNLRPEFIADMDLNNFFRYALLEILAIDVMANMIKKELDLNEHKNADLLHAWTDLICDRILNLMCVAGMCDFLRTTTYVLSCSTKLVAGNIVSHVNKFLKQVDEQFAQDIQKRFLLNATRGEYAYMRGLQSVHELSYYQGFEDSSLMVFIEDATDFMLERKSYSAINNFFEMMLMKYPDIDLPNCPFSNDEATLYNKAASLKTYVRNDFKGAPLHDCLKSVRTSACISFITEVSEKYYVNRELLLYNVDISKESYDSVATVIEYSKLLSEVLTHFPRELTMKNWDNIRISISSWVLSLAKSIDSLSNPKVLMFASAVFNVFRSLMKFIELEKTKSSSSNITTLIEEWDSLFAKEVNLVLFKCYYTILRSKDHKEYFSSYSTLLDAIVPSADYLNYHIIISCYEKQNNLTDLTTFIFESLSSPVHSIRMASKAILVKLAFHYVNLDVAILTKNEETIKTEENSTEIATGHFLARFEKYIRQTESKILEYLDEFSYKITELAYFSQIDHQAAMDYLFVWDCIILVCSKAPVRIKSLYANWIQDNKFEQHFLNFLFRAMPIEVLKNYDIRPVTELYNPLSSDDLEDRTLTVEKYAYHLYFELLRKLPVVARKWWNSTFARQKSFIDKFTINYFSNLIIQKELKKITNHKEEYENMQVSVHFSTREVIATYSLDEAKMELIITLAANYPLGGVKVENGKQIGGKAAARNFGMQLTIFLTQQNGAIFDGLSLWKQNLDKKFQGVEECFICYTVIHQDTCQLPKLSCRTCRKKFHGPCLYKWFTTSSKSTCPICRNMF